MDVMAETTITPTLLPRNSSLGANFSYPRPDRPSRHESSESRSSVTSTGSLPGMTDASDSDASFEDDCNYNTSASELWDSFWPDSTPESEQQYPAFLRGSRSRDYFNVHASGHQSHDVEDDTIKITQLEHEPKITSRSYGGAREQPSPARSEMRRAPVSYSVYPRSSRTDVRRVELPPRTSSLNPELSTQSGRKPFLRAAKSSAALKYSKSSQSFHPLDFTPPNSATIEPLPSSPPYLLSRPTTSSSSSSPSSSKATAHSVPVSPAYPPPPVPRALRPSTSALTLRENQPRNPPQRKHLALAPPLPISHNATAPLGPPCKPTAPMLRTRALHLHLPPPSAPPTGPLPSPPPPPPQQQRFVSVFEFDSDSDDDSSDADANAGSGSRRRGSDGETASRLAKRIARGLGHKKSASEKQRGRVPVTPVLGGGGGGGEFEKKHHHDDHVEGSGTGDKRGQGSLSRKRGGSLGRIFGGFMSR
ncbi:hypothetical protein F4775DRAFT_600640 [Biscogniauxia sp. FL1348]|nr:hypothetical protein F4775DRAFT_600640 [Biscogniauxia sp. FL1348]